MNHVRVKDNSAYLCKEGKNYYIFIYKGGALKKEITFGHKNSAMSFMDNFEPK